MRRVRSTTGVQRLKFWTVGPTEGRRRSKDLRQGGVGHVTVCRGQEGTLPVQETEPSWQLEQRRPGECGGQQAVDRGGATSGEACSPG